MELFRVRFPSAAAGHKDCEWKYYVGDKTEGAMTDWRENEIIVADVRWLELNPVVVAELGGLGFQNPDLSRVDEVGFTTLSRGTAPGCNSSVRVASIEVVGYPVPRAGKAN